VTGRAGAPPTEGAIIEVTIDAIDDEARGRGLLDGEHGAALDVAVRGGLPGDRVRAKIERVFAARGLAQARGLAVLEPGPLHVDRRCPHPGPCPGCPLEGVAPAFALALKRERVLCAMADAGLLPEGSDALVDDVIPTRAPRQKVKLTAGGRPGKLRFGLFVPHSHVLVGAEACPFQHEALTEALARLGPALDATGLPPFGLDARGIKAVIARVFREGVGVVIVAGAPATGAQWRLLGACVGEGPLASLAWRIDEGGGNSLLGGTIQRFVGPQALTPLEGPAQGAIPEPVDAFCQTDPILAAWLYERVAAFLAPPGTPPDAAFADLYAGTGGFSRALLAAGATGITAVERAPSSAAALALLPLESLAVSVEEALPLLGRRTPLAGLVVDPPKSGLKEAAAPLAALGAARVALVACDPDAGARDARAFVDAGYVLEAVVPIDLFPGTPEVETLFLLTRP
jgi:23S rRNA (uracil1939-C5)-methyltransferase